MNNGALHASRARSRHARSGQARGKIDRRRDPPPRPARRTHPRVPPSRSMRGDMNNGALQAFARERLEAEPSLRSAELAELIAERFGLRVHPRSVERALARAAQPKSGGEQ